MTTKQAFRTLCLALGLSALLSGADLRPVFAATIAVNTTADDITVNSNCTLREAILAANTNAAVDACAAGAAAPTQDLIGFLLGAGTPTIAISATLGQLPPLTERVTINGATGGATRVELNGGNGGTDLDGLQVTTANAILRRLVINRFTGNGIQITGTLATGNRVEGSYIGTNAAGTADLGNAGNGILVDGGASQNVIGGDVLAERNVISGNELHGVAIEGPTSTGNSLKVNYIGLDATGLVRLPNEGHGVSVDDSPQNTIGCTSPVPCLVVGGRLFTPPFPDVSLVRIAGGNAISNTVVGSYLGVGADGNTPVGTYSGAALAAAVQVEGADPGYGQGTVIGCTTITPCNVIAASSPAQVGLFGVNNVTVVGNTIGLNAAGTTSLMPGDASPDGITVNDCTGCQIGGTPAGTRNVVSGNSFQIRLTNAFSTTIEGNYIGPNAAGTGPIASNFGVYVESGSNITIGGATAASRNVISGLGGLTPGLGDGVTVTACNGCLVRGNYIGTNAAGSAACTNQRGVGVSFDVAKEVTITGNLLAGNVHEAISLEDSGNVTVTANTMGLAANGSTAIPNGDGIVLTNGMDNAQIGGTTAADRNVIAGNDGNGIIFDGWDTVADNRVEGNYIGVLADGVTARGNLYDGIVLVSQDLASFQSRAEGTPIGSLGDDARADSLGDGLPVGSLGDMGDSIGSLWPAVAPAGGLRSGAGSLAGILSRRRHVPGGRAGAVAGSDVAAQLPFGPPVEQNRIGGGVAGAGNVISGNGQHGIHFLGSNVVDNTVAGNTIGLAADGTTAVPNGQHGIELSGGAFCINPPACTVVYDTSAASAQVIGTNGDGVNDAGERNLISGNTGAGIFGAEACGLDGCDGAGSGSRISGNYIGLAANGTTARGNGGDGIRWQSGDALIGSDADGSADDGEANRIANNGGDGVRLENGGTHNTIWRNQIFANGCITCTTRLGIDLQTGTSGAGDGVNANDAGDADTGTNHFMNFPVLVTAHFSATAGITDTFVITYTADVTPTECSAMSPCRTEFFFAGDVPDASGHGEGRAYLGADTITGDVASKVVTLTLPSPSTACAGRFCRPGDLLVATLTNNLGSTSEFAENVIARDVTGLPGDCNADHVVSAADMSALVLEIFDGDGSAPAQVPGGTFPGDSVGCNPNADAVVDAGDMTCLARKLFFGLGSVCGP